MRVREWGCNIALRAYLLRWQKDAKIGDTEQCNHLDTIKSNAAKEAWKEICLKVQELAETEA